MPIKKKSFFYIIYTHPVVRREIRLHVRFVHDKNNEHDGDDV